MPNMRSSESIAADGQPAEHQAAVQSGRRVPLRYTSVKFVHLVKDSQLRQSMSRRANCWDNAPQETFFGHSI